MFVVEMSASYPLSSTEQISGINSDLNAELLQAYSSPETLGSSSSTCQSRL